MTNTLVALVALLTLGAFLAVLALRVPVLDLSIVLVLCLAMAAIDFYLALRADRRSSGRKERKAGARSSLSR